MSSLLEQWRNHISLILTGLAIGLVLWFVPIGGIAETLAGMPAGVAASVLALSLCTVLIVSARFFVLVRAMGASVPFVGTLRANVASLLSSLFLINVVGAVLGRFVFLRRYGLEAEDIAALTFFDRVLVAAVGGMVFVFGTLLVFGSGMLLDVILRARLFEIAAVLAVAAVGVFVMMRSRPETRLLARLPVIRIGAASAGLLMITVVAQAVQLICFVLVAKGLGVTTSLTLLIGAAGIVGFVASLPITVNGWGVREAASVFVLGHLGVAPDVAVATGIAVGATMTVAVLLAGGLLAFPERGLALRADAKADGRCTPPALDRAAVQRLVALVLGLGAAILVFFQLRLHAPGVHISVNLADPLAVLAAAACVLLVLSNRRLPRAVPSPFVWWWLSVTAVLVLGLAIGAERFGSNSWAVTNRVAGWVVLMGYIAIGAYLVRQWGAHGLRRLCVAMMATGVIVAVYSSVSSDIAKALGAPNFYPHNLEGFVANRNAFAFQLLIALCGGLAYARAFRRFGAEWWWTVMLGFLLFAIWETQSKTAAIVTIAVLSISLINRVIPRRTILAAVAVGGAISVVSLLLPDILRTAVSALSSAAIQSGGPDAQYGLDVPIGLFSQIGMQERWLSISRGFQMWLEKPTFGGGLGAFIELRLGLLDPRLVIHSIPVWILAELGLVGLIVIASAPIGLLWLNRRADLRRLPAPAIFLLLILITLAVYGLPHDMAYQRIFWLALGGALGAWRLRGRPLPRREG